MTILTILFCGISCDMRWHLDEMQRLPVVKTGEVSNIRNTKALVTGNVEWDGDALLTERGVCYSESAVPTISDEHVAAGNTEGDFSAQITGLTRNTAYRARAYAINEIGVAYGSLVFFTTADVLDTIPTLTTLQATEITPSSARVGGEITSDGGNEILERGICYSLEAAPDTSDAFVTTGGGDAPYSDVLTGLEDAATYFARAYAINDMGIGYGNEISFQTPLQGLPTVITLDPTVNGATIAYISGNVTSEGDAPVVTRGICYSTEPQPDANDVVIASGSGAGFFNCTLTGLQEGTTYYARAFATNSIGTVYGNEVSFNTQLGAIISLLCDDAFVVGTYTPGLPVSNGSLNLVYTGGNGGSYNAQSVNSTGVLGMVANLASGFFNNGSGNLLLTISGTPASNGNALFSLSIGGQSCTFSIPVVGGSVGSLNCSNAAVTGVYVEDVQVTNGAVSIPYTNGFGSYDSQSIYSTGVTGLIASIDEENFVSGSGNLNFVITGTPQSVGIASFSLSIGGQECTFSITVGGANVSSLNCSNAVITGDFFDGVPVNNASISISYSNGIGNYYSQGFNSLGVTGLTAIMPNGTFQSGGGTIQLVVSGTSSQPGIASFNLFIGGQYCIIEVPVYGTSEHTCGTPNVHNELLEYGSLTDQEGNIYKTIVIGTQEWMAENLNTSIYRNGGAIPTNLSSTAWQTTTNGAWTYYNDNSTFECPYGKLYNWYACVSPNQLCPLGWHVPSNNEWLVLTNYLGGTAVSGGKMKTTGLTTDSSGLWLSPNTGATNSSGFSGLPGGYRNPFGSGGGVGSFGSYWTSSENPFTTFGYVYYRQLNANNDDVLYEDGEKRNGFSVRCLRD